MNFFSDCHVSFVSVRIQQHLWTGPYLPLYYRTTCLFLVRWYRLLFFTLSLLLGRCSLASTLQILYHHDRHSRKTDFFRITVTFLPSCELFLCSTWGNLYLLFVTSYELSADAFPCHGRSSDGSQGEGFEDEKKPAAFFIRKTIQSIWLRYLA